MLKETMVFIQEPISGLSSRIALEPERRRVGWEAWLLYRYDVSPEPDFGLHADFAAPEGECWTHLLSRDCSPEAIAGLLSFIGADPGKLACAVDGDGRPIVDLGRIKGLLAGNRTSA